MNVIKFSEYKESLLTITDIVIDELGNVYNGDDGNPIIKGRLDIKKGGIIIIDDALHSGVNKCIAAITM
jgi:hypothetical protein